jgi:predicted Zn-dependent protease
VYAVPTTGFHDLERAVRTALVRWTPALGYRELTLRPVDDIRDADILVIDRAAPLPVDTTGCGATWTEAAGRTMFCPSGDTARTMPLISGDPGRTKVLVTIDVAARLDAEELLSVAVHELGHAIGLGGHSSRISDVMFAFPIVSAPSAADARTLRYVLHRRPDLRL